MKIVVNDANILIDLVELNILPCFFQLEYDFHTTEMILDELLSEQKNELQPYINIGRLVIEVLSEKDFTEIFKIRNSKTSLSEQDCSAFYQALKKNATLITSDNTLRKFAKANNIEVHGHFWVFDNLVEKGLLSGQSAIDKLKELCTQVNPKLGLPAIECQKRIKNWSNPYYI